MRFAIPLVLAVATSRGVAQSPVIAGPSTGVRAESSFVRLRRPRFGRNTTTALLWTLGVSGSIGLVDAPLSVRAQRLGGDDMSLPATIGSFVGGPVPLALGASLYALGKGTGSSFTTQTGREVLRAVLVSGSITALTKGVVGRARPYAAPGDPDVFSPGRGFTNGALASFPSGHTSAAFATATVLARELDQRHPSSRWIINPLLFGSAALVGYSRVYQRQHWPSDVLAGAALGTITGYEVVSHARGDRSAFGWHPFSHVSIGVTPAGASLQWR